eukprot:879258-Prymnesium_polylepis.1
MATNGAQQKTIDKKRQAMKLFSDWAEEQGEPGYCDWTHELDDHGADKWTLATRCDADGRVLVPTPEIIIDYMMQMAMGGASVKKGGAPEWRNHPAYKSIGKRTAGARTQICRTGLRRSRSRCTPSSGSVWLRWWTPSAPTLRATPACADGAQVAVEVHGAWAEARIAGDAGGARALDVACARYDQCAGDVDCSVYGDQYHHWRKLF